MHPLILPVSAEEASAAQNAQMTESSCFLFSFSQFNDMRCISSPPDSLRAPAPPVSVPPRLPVPLVLHVFLLWRAASACAPYVATRTSATASAREHLWCPVYHFHPTPPPECRTIGELRPPSRIEQAPRHEHELRCCGPAPSFETRDTQHCSHSLHLLFSAWVMVVFVRAKKKTSLLFSELPPCLFQLYNMNSNISTSRVLVIEEQTTFRLFVRPDKRSH